MVESKNVYIPEKNVIYRKKNTSNFMPNK